MPELPEVETIKNQLVEKIIGKKIEKVKIFLPKMVKTPLSIFKGAVLNSVINSIRRRAKLIIIDLSGGHSLLIHLKMTGQLIYEESKILNQELRKHTRVIFDFVNGNRLLFNDLRQFGYIKLLKTNEAEKLFEKEYGPEPLENNFTIKTFKNILMRKPMAKRKSFSKNPSFRPTGRKIKQFLMDQKNIAGIGNLYADEILFFAGVMPARKISTLTDKEIEKILTGIKKILKEAIKYRGSSVDNYLDARGKTGEYHLRLKVYGHKGQPCKKCKNKIQKIKLAGRGTHFCPKCQK
jgi:formamidopyrimidine-DNA glycosylase